MARKQYLRANWQPLALVAACALLPIATGCVSGSALAAAHDSEAGPSMCRAEGVFEEDDGYRVCIETDARGAFERRGVVNPPGWFDVKVELASVLRNPPDAGVVGTLQINAKDGSVDNPVHEIALATGRPTSLGRWALDGGDNILVVSGRTSPARAKTMLEFELYASR